MAGCPVPEHAVKKKKEKIRSKAQNVRRKKGAESLPDPQSSLSKLLFSILSISVLSFWKEQFLSQFQTYTA